MWRSDNTYLSSTKIKDWNYALYILVEFVCFIRVFGQSTRKKNSTSVIWHELLAECDLGISIRLFKGALVWKHWWISITLTSNCAASFLAVDSLMNTLYSIIFKWWIWGIHSTQVRRHPGFESQVRHHHKFKTGVSVTPHENWSPQKNCKN